MASLARPGSSMSSRPLSISQPSIPTALDLNNVPSELQLVLGLLSLQAQRPYCDGYVLRKHANLPGNLLRRVPTIAFRLRCLPLAFGYGRWLIW